MHTALRKGADMRLGQTVKACEGLMRRLVQTRGVVQPQVCFKVPCGSVTYRSIYISGSVVSGVVAEKGCVTFLMYFALLH